MPSRSHMRLLNRVTAHGSADAGVVMILVVMTMVLATAFVTAGLAYSAQSQRFSRHDQDWNAALAAAQAGVEDYIAHLNRNDNYARQVTFADCANVAIQGPKAPSTNTCSWTSSTPVGWQPVNPGQPGGPAFHYDVDPSDLDRSGTVQVTSTGRVNGVRRTLQSSVGRGGSTDFLYYTDHEDADPDNQVSYPSAMPANCYLYWWGRSKDTPKSVTAAQRKGNNAGCREITFIGGDVFDGKVHTNDTPLYSPGGNGALPTFLQGVETSDPACKAAVRTNSSTWTACDRNGTGAQFGTNFPVYAEALDLADNSEAFSGYPGCQYSGATRIKFNSDGTMTVWSKETSPGTSACGGSAPFGKTVPVPNDMVIYAKAAPTQRVCKAGEIDGTLPLGTYDGTNKQASYTQDANTAYTDQHCGRGNMFIEGTLKGRVTVAAQNSIVITNDMLLAGGLTGSDLLGLVASNSVEIYHPVLNKYDCVTAKKSTSCAGTTYTYGPPTSTTYPRDVAGKGFKVYASIQTLQHSFFVQSYDQHAMGLGKLTVVGSIAQKWRGAVGTGDGTTGYFKDYSYDKRLKYSSPPYFPQFINAVWSSRAVGEVQAAY
jgi:hypothetical protein